MKVIFLDRDGVINRYPGDYKYVTSWQEFKFLRGVKSALRKLSQANCKIFVVSNQAGVSKGIFSQKALDEITQNMLKELKKYKIHIEKVLYCTHREEDNCSCRKPKTGLLKMAIETLGKIKINKNDCFFIGDTIRDIQTGKAFGCQTILVFSGKEKPENKNNWQIMPDFTAENLLDACRIVLNDE